MNYRTEKVISDFRDNSITLMIYSHGVLLNKLKPAMPNDLVIHTGHAGRSVYISRNAETYGLFSPENRARTFDYLGGDLSLATTVLGYLRASFPHETYPVKWHSISAAEEQLDRRGEEAWGIYGIAENGANMIFTQVFKDNIYRLLRRGIETNTLIAQIRQSFPEEQRITFLFVACANLTEEGLNAPVFGAATRVTAFTNRPSLTFENSASGALRAAGAASAATGVSSASAAATGARRRGMASGNSGEEKTAEDGSWTESFAPEVEANSNSEANVPEDILGENVIEVPESRFAKLLRKGRHFFAPKYIYTTYEIWYSLRSKVAGMPPDEKVAHLPEGDYNVRNRQSVVRFLSKRNVYQIIQSERAKGNDYFVYVTHYYSTGNPSRTKYTIEQFINREDMKSFCKKCTNAICSSFCGFRGGKKTRKMRKNLKKRKTKHRKH
jgi:hypothetical protein